MIEALTITTLIEDKEKIHIYHTIGADNWNIITTNCITAKPTNKSYIESIALIIAEKRTSNNKKTIRYNVLSITFSFTTELKSYNRHIRNAVKKLFPFLRTVDFKVNYIRYGYTIDTPYSKQYFDLLKSGFSMAHREMSRNIENNKIVWENKDTKITVIKQDNILYIHIGLDKRRIHFLIKNLHLKNRTTKYLLTKSCIKKMESYVLHSYINAICGTGSYHTLTESINIISDSSRRSDKKQHLIQFITEISKYKDIETFLNHIEQGKLNHVQNRKKAMDYIRDLNAMDINPLTFEPFDNTVTIPSLISIIN